MWIAHVEAERARVNEPLALVEEELQIINDPKQTAQARVFATEKLAAAATLLEQIVQSARDYEGNRGPEDSDDETRTVSEEPATIPLQDPTSGVADFFVQPPPTAEWPAASAPCCRSSPILSRGELGRVRTLLRGASAGT